MEEIRIPLVLYPYDFNYVVDPNVDIPVMLLNQHIGCDEELGNGIYPEIFQAELMKLDAAGKSRIKIVINSIGGSVMGGMAIFDAILKTKTPVDTHVCGVAASISAVIFLAGKVRSMSDFALLMYHNPYNPKDPNYKDLVVFKNALVGMIASRVNKTVDEVSAMMDQETFLTAEEAIAGGFATEIETSEDFNKKRAPRLTPGGDIAAMWKESSLIINKLFIQNSIKMDLSQIINACELPAGSDMQKVTDAILTMKNQMRADKLAIETANKANLELAQTNKDLTDKVTTLEAENKTAKEAETATILNEATEVVNAAKEAGKITEDSVPTWLQGVTNRAELDALKNKLDAIAANKKAPPFKAGGNNTAIDAPGAGVAKVANKMFKMREKYLKS